ncbi:MAG: hypothetical protein P8X96_20060 [Desulfobacteraceae bacterium]
MGITGVALGLIVGLLVGFSFELSIGLIFGAISCCLFGLLGGLNRGGAAVVKHYALRLILWLSRYTPFKFIQFLDYGAKLIILKKVGGGYMFIHRMLLEHFAEIEVKERMADAPDIQP